MRRAGIPNRLGIRGYAGGDNWCHHCVQFKEDRHVADSALEFLSLLGSKKKVEPRPRIYLSKHETKEAYERWGSKNDCKCKIVIAPGGGFSEKCWGDRKFNELTKLLSRDSYYSICIIGSDEDRKRIQIQQSNRLKNFCGKLSLRQSSALVSTSDFVVTNSSVCMHFAGAFKIPSLTLLGEWYESAALHHKQWGYPEGIILGKETISGIDQITSINDALIHIQKYFQVHRP